MDANSPVEGIRISPPVVEYRDIAADVVYQIQITIQNFGKISRRIRFHAPSSEVFQLHCKNPDRVIAPGLEVSALVEFCGHTEEDHQSKFILLVDDKVVEIPLLAFAPKPSMEITGPVDFGTVIADGKVLRQEIAILNRGSKNGKFKLTYAGNEPITIVPQQGVVKAGYSQPIRFEFISKRPGKMNETVSVNLEGQPACQVHILANIAKRSLLLLSMEDEKKVDHVDFGATYYGTDVLRSFVLFNQSPDPVSFVVILEEDGEGQELGVDLSLTKSTAFSEMNRNRRRYEDNDLTSLVTACPTQGTLGPYDKRLMHFKFSPRFSKSSQGWLSTEKPEPRRDYAVFVHIDIVGNIVKLNGKTTPPDSNDSRVEVALTGTALPVFLSILPSPTINFDNCPVGSSLDCAVTIRNDSPDLPVSFVVPKSAHFIPFPHTGCLEPTGFMELLISFRPNQIGNFRPKMNIVVVGYTVEIGGDFSSLPKFKQKSIFKYPLQIEGTSLPVVGKKTAKSLSAQGRLLPPEQNDSFTDLVQSGLGTSLKVFSSDDTNAGLMRSKASGISSMRDCKKSADFPALVAKPDDRAMSIRPSNKKEKIVTQFTKTERYTYVDPDYEYNFEEDEERRQHRQRYVDYIQRLRKQKAERDKASELNSLNNPVDIGIKSNGGLQPTKLKIKEIKSKGQKKGNNILPQKSEKQLLTSKSLQTVHQEASKKRIADGLKALPTTSAEKIDCSKTLSPKELYQIVLEPKIIDFGEVCAKSLASKKLKIVNSLETHIHIKAEIECRELRQTSPLSQVIPPGSVAALEFIFESNVIGKFERSVSYSINDHHKAHLIVLAEVVTVALSLSTDEVSVLPSPGLPPDAGMRKTVTLQNKRNMVAEFSWSPVVGKDGTAFSVRPARGTVNPNASLECEVVFYPSYYAPLAGFFQLNIDNGNQLQLKTSAEIAPTSCTFVEHRVMFGAVPLNLVTNRSAFLKNTSQNHAFFKVVDPSPIPGMTITPRTGVVPVGGTAELVVNYKPLSVQKFDTQIEVAIRGWKPIFLRMGGHVEAPCVDIDLESFQFGGIFCGARAIIPFKLRNLARSRARVTFDLSQQRDFALRFDEFDEEGHEVPEAEGCFEVGLIGQQELQCFMEFNPVEVASYDFTIPAVINQTVAPMPPPSPYPASVSMSKAGHNSEELDKNDLRRISQFPTPSRRVQGTGLRAPLQVSNTELNFHLPSGYHEMGIETSAGRAAGIMFVNNSNSKLTWHLNLEQAGPYIENGTFQILHRSGSPYQFASENKSLTIPERTLLSGETSQLGILFSPDEPGVYEANIPVVLNGDIHHPYRVLHLVGKLDAPRIRFEPAAIHFFPIPLRTKTTLEFNLVAKGYRRAVEVKCVIPEVELEDGSELRVLDVAFPNGNVIQPCCQDFGEKEPLTLLCQISFEAPKPVSFSTAIEFVTGQDSHHLPVIATADNCLLTCYKFLAIHQSDFHIVCEELNSNEMRVPGITGKKAGIAYGDAIFVPCVSAIKSPTENSNITTSTSFGLSTSTYPESSMSSSTARSPTEENKEEEDHDETTAPYEYYGTEDTAETEEEKYLKDVLKSVQRWYSSQAWASGPSPITLPNSLRSCFGPGMDDGGTTRAGIWSREKKKDNKTVFDIVTHLCGKAIPGIPINASVPTEAFERTRHLHWMYATLLTFLRCQGAMVASILPEYLLDGEDFKRLVMIRQSEMSNAGVKFYSGSLEREQERYENLSKHAWTDLLLQIIKVLVLNRITPQQYRKIVLPSKSSPLPALNADPLSSNVFSVGERIIVAWVNYHYQQQRTAGLWKTSIDGQTPSSRWIVNFDNDFLDGLVLASVLAAYVPFIIPKFFHSMYTHPSTAEQCLHNALKVVEAIRYLGMDYDIVATDITEPNPISMLMLCIYLYHRLPHYIPRSKIEFTGPLHSDVVKQVKLQNPSSKPIVYQVIIAGEHASDFNVPSGRNIKVPSKGHIQLPIEYRSRFLRSCSAVLILVGKRTGSQVGSTLVFNLSTAVNTITPVATIKAESPCYEMKKIYIDVKNPFKKGATFKIILVEAKQNPQAPSQRPKKKIKQSTLKKVESKIDHGIKRKPDLKKSESLMETQNAAQSNDQEKTELSISAFWCPAKELHIEAYGNAKLEIQFLPFSIGHRQCSVLFLNEDVGELVYSIEAESLLPLPASLPFQPSSHSVRVSSAAVAEKSNGLFGGDDRIVYWQCSVNDEIAEEILLPIINDAKEKALVKAAQQRMSEKELRRREITGSLSVATVANALKSMGISRDSLATTSPSSLTAKSNSIGFVVEGSSKYFTLPKLFDMNVSTDAKYVDDNAKLPVTFVPEGPGHYQCRLVLRAPNDIRVYQIEVTVNPEGSDIELEFTSPTHESVTQKIPVVNSSERDWTLIAKIEGEGFYGPDQLFCPMMTSESYSLTFKPMYEGIVKGQLRLMNTISGTETIFLLRGEGRKPLQYGHVELDCQVKQATYYDLEIPNVTNRKMVFQAFCDLDFISGPSFITVLPKQTAKFTMAVKPWRRGVFDGVISFVSDDDVTKILGLDRTIDSDSDEDDVALPDSTRSSSNRVSAQLPDLASQKSIFSKPYRLWYSMRIVSSPSPPTKTIEVECPCHNRAAVEILVENPTDDRIEYEVFVEGSDLIAGDELILVHPRTSGLYQVDYAPTVIGKSRGSVIFQHPAVGEIWFDLILEASSPPPRELHLMQCPLGSKCHQMIRLDNPTDDFIVYSVTCSNIHNFQFELNEQKIELPPHSGMEVPLTFSPSALGLGKHKAEIIFKSKKLGDLVFIVNGSGQPPVPSADHVIRSSLSGSSSTIISFENPFQEDIIVNVDLQERALSITGTILNVQREQQISRDQAFSLLLRQPMNILLPTKTALDIPICFAPDSMMKHEATCYVTATKTDGSSFETHGQVTKFPYNCEMRWVFPIKGIPEACPIKDSKAPHIECKARSRLEERLELSFTGLNMNMPNTTHAVYLRALSPSGEQGRASQYDFGPDYAFLPEDFKYEFDFADTESQIAIERSVGVNLVRKMSHKISGVVTLLFNVVFSPHRSFSHLVHLIVSASSGGVWRFPLKFIATEPAPDDVIQLEAAGLNKEVSVGFRLTSQTDNDAPYWVSLEANGDQMFSVTPLSGVLPPVSTLGELIVVSYKPTYYGKTHLSKLHVQTADMQWIYELRGVLPRYQPPIMLSSQDMQEKHVTPHRTGKRNKNYVRDNLNIKSTATSSPLKGDRLVERGRTVATDTR